MSTTTSKTSLAAGTADAMIPALAGVGPIKVWSMLVTILGDLTLDRDVALSTALLLAMTGRVGIRADAVRVALHRLVKDGWVVSERAGRTSRHRLTPFGREESRAAQGRIYPSGSAPRDYALVIADRLDGPGRLRRADAMRKAGFSQVSSDLYVGAAGRPVPFPDMMPVPGPEEPVPPWMAHLLAGPESVEGYRALLPALEALVAALQPGADPELLDASVLRVLVIHHWRRQVLRHPDLPGRCFPDAWRGHDCRALVQHLLGRLVRPCPTSLEQVVATLANGTSAKPPH